MDILSMPALSAHGVYSLGMSLDGFWDAIAELDYTNGRFSYEGRDQYIAGALDLKTNQELWEFKNPSRPTTRPMISPPPVFVLPGCAGYISVIDGKATAHDVKGNVLWSQPLPHPADYWNAPDRMQRFSQIFVVQDRDEQAAPIAAFDRRGGSLRWQSSVAKSGDIVATDDSGEHQLFVKDGKYSLLRLPDSGAVACQLADDQDVQFTPNGRFLIALPALPGGAVWSRASSTFSIIDAKTGTLVRTVRVAEPN
jgi:outer membrane protein assembly factor BamB